MARKAKRNDLEPAKVSEDQIKTDSVRHPHIVGWLVLIVGAGSTWYWYRPLPNEVMQSVHSVPGTHAIANDHRRTQWADNRFEIPDIEDFLEETKDSKENEQGSKVPPLLGAPTVALVPQSEPSLDLNQVLKSVIVPMVPLSPPSVQTTNPPSLWTDPEPPERNNKPKTHPKQWPDSNYVPSSQSSLKSQGNNVSGSTIPPLLEAGSRIIRLKDEAESTHANAPANKQLNHPTDPPRQPQFIRQPTAPPK